MRTFSLCRRLALAAVFFAPTISVRAQEEDALDEAPTLPPTIVVGEPQPGEDQDGAFPEDLAADGLGEDEVITPTRTETRAALVGSSLSVIDSQELERGNYRTVAEALRIVPGVNVVRTGPRGGLTTVFLRGANSQHTKVLIDGIPVNDPSNAGRLFDFSTLGLDNVERIEVLRGPQSTLYGSDAIGGVINIITQRGEGPLTVRGELSGGSFGTHRELLGVSAGDECSHFSLTGSWIKTEGFSAAESGAEDDGFEASTLAGRFGAVLTESLEADVTFRRIDARAEIDDAPFSLGQPPSDDPFRKNLTDQFFTRVALTHVNCSGNMEQIVAFNFAGHEREDIDDQFPATFDGQTREVQYQANMRLAQWSLFTIGADYLTEDATQEGFGDIVSASQNNAGAYLQDQIQIGEHWLTTVGYRWDEHSAAGPAQTYRFTSIYHIEQTSTKVRGSIGRGFRAPSLPENLFPFGNPNLRPETSKGWDYGLEQELLCGDLVLGGAYFRNDFDNLILFDLTTFTLENIGSAKAHGVELFGLWDLTDELSLRANYTRTDSRDDRFNLPLVRRPQHEGAVVLTRRWWEDRATLSIYGIFVGNRLDSRDGSAVLDGYEVVNVSGQWKPSEKARWFFRIENLFDEPYQEATGFATPGLSGYAGVELWH